MTNLQAISIADEFLDLWEIAHTDKRPNEDDYTKLAHEFARRSGYDASMGEAGQVQRALHKGRKARGWPDTEPAADGRKTLEPAIEVAIVALWFGALRDGAPQ